MAGWGRAFDKVTPYFASGVHTSAEPDLVPQDALIEARNAGWQSIGDGSAIVRKRRGAFLMNRTTALPSAITYQFVFKWRDPGSGVYTQFHLLFTDTGLAYEMNSAGGINTVPDLTFGAGEINGQVANNIAFFANAGGVTYEGAAFTGIKFDAKDWTRFGIVRPPPPTATAGGAGAMTGTYDVAVTYYNSETGHESSRSDSVQVTVSSQTIVVNWIAPSDPQVTDVRVYLRKTNISINFYQAASVTVGTFTTTLDLDDDAYNGLIIVAPDIAENDPPPAGIKYLAWHRSRLFAADDTKIYYSQIGLPEAFDPESYELVAPDDGQRITGLLAIADVLVVFKEASTYALVGDGPNDWVIRLVARDVGSVAQHSVVTANSQAYWWSEQGPVLWTGEGIPQLIGTPLIATLISNTAINPAELGAIFSEVDLTNQRILFAVPQIGHTYPNAILPFNYQLGQWEGIWDPFDLGSFATADDGNGQPWIFVGGRNGRVYRWWDSDLDGFPGGTQTGTVIAGATTLSQITGSGFSTSPDLLGLTVYLYNGTTYAYAGRATLTTGTNATTLVFAAPITGLTVGTAYTYYIATPHFQLVTRWEDHMQPFTKKRFEYFYLQAKTPGTTVAYLDFAYNFDESAPDTRVLTLTGGGSSAIWDQSLWDVATYSSTLPTSKRIRVGHTGRAWRVRLRQIAPNQPLALSKIGMRGEFLTDKK